MTTRNICIMLFTVILLGCNKSTEENLKDEGYYTLTGIRCACPTFEILENIQQCKLDREKGILTVKTFFDNVERNLFLKEGEYPVIINEEKESIYIDEKNYFFFWSEDFLLFDSGLHYKMEGAPTYYFQKNKVR